MVTVYKYIKQIPYVYFMSIIVYWFTMVNKENSVLAYPILLFGIPFLWQLIKPSIRLNFSLGIIFVCLSSYILFAYLSDLLDIINFSENIRSLLFYGGTLVLSNMIMSLWIVKNSTNKVF
ncbi:hypothetical protein [Winogradskyella sp.]